MARNQSYFGPNDETNTLPQGAWVEITNANAAELWISVLTGSIEFIGTSGAEPAAGARGTPMRAGDVMLRRPLSELFAAAGITRVYVKAVHFQTEIVVSHSDA